MVAFACRCYSQPFKYQATLHDHNIAATQIVATPDAKKLIEGDEQGNILIRNAQTAAIEKQIKAHSQAVSTIDFNSTGRLIISTSTIGEVTVYDLFNDRILHKIYSTDFTSMRFAAFSIADGFIYFNGQGRLYKTRSDLTQEVIKVFDFPDSITGGVITPDRSALIISLGKNLYVINTRSDEVIQQVYAGASPLMKLYITPSNMLMGWAADGSVTLWKLSLGQVITPFYNWFKATYSNAAFSHTGKWMVSGNIGNWARLWNMEKTTSGGRPSVEQELFSHTAVVQAFGFSTDDQTLFTASKDNTIKVWKIKLDSIPAESVAEVIEAKPKVVMHPDSTVKSPPAVVPKIIEAPVVKMLSHNVPASIKGRQVKKAGNFEVKKSSVEISIFDNDIIDGDTVSLFFNGEWILRNYGVVREKRKITIKLQPKYGNK